MRKLILIGLALTLSFGSFAQEKRTAKKTNKTINPASVVEPTEARSTARPNVSGLNTKGTNDITRVEIGKSANIYSVLLEEQRCLDYNNEVGVTAFTFRADPATYPTAINSGSIITATSSNGGANWSENWLALTTDELNRYPSGVVYNPSGNTDATQAYAVAAGPVSVAGAWEQNFFGSIRLDGENGHLEFINKDAGYSGSQLTRFGMQACENGYTYIVGPKYQDDGAGYSTELVINTMAGEFDGTVFSWEESDIDVDLALRNDGTTKNIWTFGSAWSNNGAVGYTWMIGQLESMVDDGGYQPIVFRSTDSGDNWDEVEVMLADNEVISEYLIGTQQGTEAVWPLCSEVAGSVDNNGNLQMFISAKSTFSMHPDSIGYSYTGDLDYIFNLELNADGVQNVLFVDSIMGGNVADDSEYAYGGTTGWGNRLSSSKTDDEKAIFVIWSDTPNAADFNNENAKPDIKAAGRFTDGDFTDFPVTNFTADDLYTGYYFFIYASQHAKIENGYVVIPTTTTVTPTEYGSNGELDAVTHTYLDGVKYLWVEGVNDGISSATAVKVSQNTPNPFNGSTRITVTTETSADVTIEVTNIMGQTIYTSNEGRINGSKEITLNANNMEAGVYFYTVTVGNNRITKKMIVK